MTVVVFADGPGGGNPAPVVLDAAALSDERMRRVAAETGHESAFVVGATGPDVDVALRFWVPEHEMEMCGHATIGAIWLLAQRRRIRTPGEVRVQTASGTVRAQVDEDGSVRIDQPRAEVQEVAPSDELLDVLALDPADLADAPVLNATTSRTKTLVPVRGERALDALQPRFERVRALCDRLGSTGLYPYAATGDHAFSARQLPRSSGYPEDAATGIAAAALVGGLARHGSLAPDGRPFLVRQGVAMGRPSRIRVALDEHPDRAGACWISGPVHLRSS